MCVLQGYFSLCSVGFCSFLDSTIRGLPIMLTRVIKVSPFPIYLKCRDVWILNCCIYVLRLLLLYYSIFHNSANDDAIKIQLSIV